MKILIVSHNYPRFRGDPAGAYVARLARAAAGLGAQVRIVAPHAPGAVIEEDDTAVRVRRFRYAPDWLERVGYRGDTGLRTLFLPRTAVIVPIYLAAFARAIRRTMVDFSPDVIHAHWWVPGGWLVSGLGLPYIVTCHGSDVRLAHRSRWLRNRARSVMRRAGAVTTVSRFLANDIERLVPALSRSVRVTPMPVDIEFFRRGRETVKANPPRILYAGNLVESKGVDLVIRAFSLLRRRGIACRLRILGEGPALSGLQTLARDLGTFEDIEWSGFVAQGAMPTEYGASTVTVLASRAGAEGLGLTLVEALLAGCAVVGTTAGGIPEVVEDGETGLLAREGDAADLAAKLEWMLSNPELRTRLTEQGSTRVAQVFGPATAIHRFMDIYNAAISHHHAKS